MSLALAVCPLSTGVAAETSSQDTGSTTTSSSANSGTFDFEGEFSGYLEADGFEAAVTDETATATEAGQVAALAKNGGALKVTGSKLEKSGNADLKESAAYGVNSVALAANDSSRVILDGTALQAKSAGSSGLFATDGATTYANSCTVLTKGEAASGLDATYRGTVIANELDVRAKGDQGAAVAAGIAGYTSTTNSTLAASGDNVPILRSSGYLEADNVTGSSKLSSLAQVTGFGKILVANSNLTSKQTKADDASGPMPIGSAVAFYRSDSDAQATSSDDLAVFQALDSTLQSSLKSGALFYLTNTEAKVLLSDVKLDYDSSAVKLMSVCGNSVSGWGQSGENGATVSFTGIDQKLKGDIEADSISFLDFYLLDGSTWEGASSIKSGAQGASVTENLTVNIDADSAWTVSENSTVTNLNLASGAKLVDKEGDSVKIVDADGLTLVDGASKTSITVLGDFSTTVKTSSVNALEGARVDRAAFDDTFGTQTTFGANGVAPEPSDEEKVEQLMAAIREWFGRTA